MEKKQFILQQIAPYFKDPSLCGFDGFNCRYLTPDGKMCVAGKNMLHPEYQKGTISDIFYNQKQEEVFIPEVVGILLDREWVSLQIIHDFIATDIAYKDRIQRDLYPILCILGITYKELKEAANNL